MASTPSSASGGRSPGGSSTVLPYRMHVSQRYLDLTRQKLDLARLPREPQTRQNQANVGVSKAQLEPLVDHWTEDYNWREQEAYYNEVLPQFRLAIHGTRIHFVHRRSNSMNAIPLLVAHGWPESFIAVSHVIEALCNPVSTPPRGDENVPTFHIVVPSIPGTGFSDQVAEEGNNIATTAEAFDALMKSLGYSRYIAHGSGWGFRICRMIALTHPESCMAVHTANPEIPPPSMPGTPLQVPMQVPVTVPGLSPPVSPGALQQQQRERPQTVSYALCDSPVGLLAYVVDAIRLPRHQSPPVSRSSSNSPRPPTLPDPWSPTALISWAMMYWLPGPEVALRWLSNSGPMLQNLWTTHSTVPLAISQFGDQHSSQSAPMWAEAYHRIAMVRRRAGSVRFAAWERPGEIVLDLRELAMLVAPSYFGGYVGPGAMMEH
ncbi:hypothetical protein M409DRAFT_68469 [Zasmidium cellare ATCC 36951]|uniref:Epoxide hydrolase N-terminal domain-containing protein n=1 Tax=Zasmidium cellare ATCC 36951 TaxID=1080233 RepID=A0A6A6C960_ZASCE|nr:uncharacterized protein M409DRAFT_68469 [Zasmidium cellare ATCC 36951]KAF2163565.1 hypothetical protein M409DRAFT_68469 [Zasmidium cellare ATCC 36951]